MTTEPGSGAVPAISRIRALGARYGILWRVITAVVLIGVGLRQLDLAAVADALQNVRPGYAALGTLLLLLGQVVSGLRWHALTSGEGRPTSRWFVIAYLRGCFFNVFLPTGIGGDAIRVAALRHGRGLKAAGRSVVLDRVTGIVTLGLAALILLPFTDYLDGGTWKIAGAVVAAAASVSAAALAILRGYAGALLWALVFVGGWCSGIVVLGWALALDVSLADGPMITLILAIAIALPVSIGGNGTREAGMVVAVAPLGIAAPAAVAYGLCFGIALALVGLVGAPLKIPRLTGGLAPTPPVGPKTSGRTACEQPKLADRP